MKNAISVSALSEFTHEVKLDSAEGMVKYGVELDWQSGTRSRAKALSMEVGRHVVSRDFEWMIDEPRQILGTNQAPNPQEYLLSAIGSCILVAFTIGASMMDIQLEQLKVTVRGDLNLAGFLAVDDHAPVGFSRVDYHIEVVGDATLEQFEVLRQRAIAHSPNAMTIMKSVDLQGQLVINKR